MNEIQKVMIKRIKEEIWVIQNDTRIKNFSNMLEQIIDYYPKGQEKLALLGLKEMVLNLLQDLIKEVMVTENGDAAIVTNGKYKISVAYQDFTSNSINIVSVYLRSYLITRLSTSITELSYKNRRNKEV